MHPILGGRSQSYTRRIQKMFGPSIIAYWPMDESAGTVAYDKSGNGYNGAYTGVTLGQAGIGDKRTCPLFDAANDYMQPPAGFRTAFTPTEFTIFGWAIVSGVGVWTDGVTRFLMRILVDASNTTGINKNSTNNTLQFIYTAGGTTDQVFLGSQSSVAWMSLGLTVSVSGDALKAYLNGVQVGSTASTLGTWVGTPAAANTLVGAGSTTPTFVFDGKLAHVGVLNRAATAGEMLAVGVL